MAEHVSRPLAGLLNGIYLLSMLLVIAGILTAAMTFQFALGELPCPLCLLQRAAMFGVCFAIITALRYGDSARITALGLVFTIMLLIISARQTLLDIFPRPGHEYIGSTIFGIHMPVWSVFIALALLGGYTIKLLAFGDIERQITTARFPSFRRMVNLAGIYVIILCGINFLSVIVQCGFDACHTFGYRLLQ